MATLYNKGVAEDINAAYFRGESLSGIWHKGEFWPLTNDLYYYGLIRGEKGELTKEEFEAGMTQGVEYKGDAIAAILTEENILDSVEKGWSLSDRAGDPEQIITFPSDIEVSGDGDYYVYCFYAFPTKKGTISKYKDVASSAYSDAWAQKEITINGVEYTVCYYANGSADIGEKQLSFEK